MTYNLNTHRGLRFGVRTGRRRNGLPTRRITPLEFLAHLASYEEPDKPDIFALID